MKLSTKIALAAVAASFSMGAFAACGQTSVVTIDAAQKGGKSEYTPVPDETCYAQQKFTIFSSANVELRWIQSETNAAVGAGSTKGRNVYSGISDGGRVQACGDPTTGSDAATGNMGDPDLTKVDNNGCWR